MGASNVFGYFFLMGMALVIGGSLGLLICLPIYRRLRRI